jgi:hypothetical protein
VPALLERFTRRVDHAAGLCEPFPARRYTKRPRNV